MAFQIALEDLRKEDTIDANKILQYLLNPENINMKTHIMSPVVFSILEGVIVNIEDLLTEVGSTKLKLPKTKAILEEIRDRLKEFLVSWNRESRKEITKTLQSIRQEQNSTRTFAERLLGMNK